MTHDHPSPPEKALNPAASGPGGPFGSSPATSSPSPWRPELQANGIPVPAGGDPLLADPTPEQEFNVVSPGRRPIRPANIAFFGAFLVGVGLVAFMSLRQGPRALPAAQQQAQQQANSAIENFLVNQAALRAAGLAGKADAVPGAKSTGQSDAARLLDDSHGLVRMFNNFTSLGQIPLTDLKTNPFAYSTDPSGTDAKLAAQAKAAAAEAAAEAAARKKRMEQARSDLEKLKLQTVLSGPAGRQAMINGGVLKVGDQTAGFTITDIQPQKVVLTRDGEAFTLEVAF